MYRDRVYETSTSTGTGNFTLAGAVSGYRTFSAAFSTNPAYYVIVNRAVPTEWEVGSFTVSTTTLTRVAGNVLAGSAGAGVRVNFSAGTKDVYNAPPAAAMQNWAAAVSGGIAEYGNHSQKRVRTVTISKTGDTITIGGTAACDCNCDCNC